MTSKNLAIRAWNIGIEGQRKLSRFYYSNGNVRTLPLRLRFRDLRRAFYLQLWQDAATGVGAEFERWRNGYHVIHRNGMTTPVYLTQVNLNSMLLDKILMDKELTQDLLARRQYPIPQNVTISVDEKALADEFFHEHGCRVVVKPAGGTAGGRGVTTDISDLETLKYAIKDAGRYAPKVLVEEYVTGRSYRLLYLGNRFVDAVCRGSPVVTGDGQNTIRQLIKNENSRRLQERPVSALLPLLVDRECRLTLKVQNLTVSSVPAKGEQVVVKNAVNENSAQQNSNVRDKVHRTTVELGETIMRDFGITLGGIDVQCTDISRPLAETGGRILEINSPPGIHHHYFITPSSDGAPVAELLLEYMFSNRQGVMLQPAR